MKRSIKKEIQEANSLVLSTRAKIQKLIQDGKKVHIIWDFDGVLSDSRSDDVFALTGFDLKAYFAYEERLLFESPGRGPWLLPIAHNSGKAPHFPPECFTQDIVTARSSTLAMRVQIFCLTWRLPVRWMLFLGHQPKKESYRIILQSVISDPDYVVFCVDDNAKHVSVFEQVATEEGMADRAVGIVAPIIRAYKKSELRDYLAQVMSAAGSAPIRVRDPANDMSGFFVLPQGPWQFREYIDSVVSKVRDEGYYSELRDAFVRVHGEVGAGRFKIEDELRQAMKSFIVDLHT